MFTVTAVTAILVVLVGSAMWGFRGKRDTFWQKASPWISFAVGLFGVLYGAYGLVMIGKFWPWDILLVSLAQGVIIGIAVLSWLRSRRMAGPGRG